MEIKETYAVPCGHSAAKDGVFHAKPASLEYHQRADSGEYGATYFMADVERLIEMVQKTDPDMMGHARRKYRGETPEQWLEYNSEEYPYDTGSFSYRRIQTNRPKDNLINALKEMFGIKSAPPEYKKQLTLSTGNAGMLILLQEAGVKEIPIGVQTDNRQDTSELVRAIGTGHDPIIMEQKKYPNWNTDAEDALTM